LASVRGAEAVCSQYDSPDGVARRFQARRHKVEPAVPNGGRHLLAKTDLRSSVSDEPRPDGEQVALVVDAAVSPSGGEGLAWGAAGPALAVVGPSCESQGVGPAQKPTEEVALGESVEVGGLNKLN
jgi:hypothetical protein